MSREVLIKIPDRYGHINQISEEKGGRVRGKGVIEGKISRKEAAHRIFDIMKKLGLPWQRKTKTTFWMEGQPMNIL